MVEDQASSHRLPAGVLKQLAVQVLLALVLVGKDGFQIVKECSSFRWYNHTSQAHSIKVGASRRHGPMSSRGIPIIGLFVGVQDRGLAAQLFKLGVVLKKHDWTMEHDHD